MKKPKLFNKANVNAPRQNVAFTGRGFLPDYMSEHAFTMMPEASRTTLEVEGVYGREGMMPPPGTSANGVQLGQKIDEGAGGAGSFASSTAGIHRR